MASLRVALLVALLLAGGVRAEDAPPASPFRGGGPATYVGVLPCADCPGIRHALNVLPDGVYFLRTAYLGRGENEGQPFDAIGRWTLAADSDRLLLRGSRGQVLHFALEGADTLRVVDPEGREIASEQNRELVRTPQYRAFEPRLPMRGLYRYMADAALFQECVTGLRMPVALEAENATLERAYLATPHEPGEPLVVGLEGRLVQRPPMEGEGSELALRVERFTGVWPGETCGSPFAEVPLENTDWKLVRLGERPVLTPAGAAASYLRLESEGRKAVGFGGCNRFFGSYAREGAALRFSRLGSTQMACPDGAGDETGFLKALAASARFGLEGEHLELYGPDGALLARFEARAGP